MRSPIVRSGKALLSQPQSITQKGVHAHPLTARECEHWFFAAFIEFFRGRPRGGDNFTSFSKCSRPFLQSVKSTLSDLKSCKPRWGHPVKHRLKHLRHFLASETKKSAQRPKFSAGHPCGHPAKKLRSGPPNPGKNKHFGTDMPRGRPRKKLRSGKLQTDFSFPIAANFGRRQCESPLCDTLALSHLPPPW